MDRAVQRVAAQAGKEMGRLRDPARMEFGIAAGEPDRIGIGRRGFVGQGGEGQDFSARIAPTGQELRVSEGEGFVPGDGDRKSTRLNYSHAWATRIPVYAW